MQASKLATILFSIASGIALGSVAQAVLDNQNIQRHRQAEMQANGLEDQCKAALRTAIAGHLTAFANGSWKLEHIHMPACKDGLKRTVDIPERDEVDALTVNCGVEGEE